MAHFPDIIIVKPIDAITKSLVPNLAVHITLFCHRMNEYQVMMPFCNSGVIEISKSWLEEEIHVISNYYTFGTSKLEDCQPRLKLDVLSEPQVKKALEISKTFVGLIKGITQERIDCLTQSQNKNYVPLSKLVDLNGQRNLEVELLLKKAEVI
jgi:hypothetical protein